MNKFDKLYKKLISECKCLTEEIIETDVNSHNMKRFPKEVENAIIEFMRDCLNKDFNYVEWPIDKIDYHTFEDLEYINKLQEEEPDTYGRYGNTPYLYYEALANCATYDKDTNTITFNFSDLEESNDLEEFTELHKSELVNYFNDYHNKKNDININWVLYKIK